MNETLNEADSSSKPNSSTKRLSLADIYPFDYPDHPTIHTDRQYERGSLSTNKNRSNMLSNVLSRGTGISQDKLSTDRKSRQNMPSSDRPMSLRSSQRMNICLNDYEYYEKRILQSQANTKRLSFSPSSKEDGISEVSNIIQRNMSNEPSYQEFDLQAEIDNVEDFGTVKLPGQNIKVECLNITKPVTIIGNSNASMEIMSSVNVDLSRYPKYGKKVVISECAITFESLSKRNISSQLISTQRLKESDEYRISDKKSYSDHLNVNQSHYLGAQVTEIRKHDPNSNSDQKIFPLFIISSNTLLEVRDCTITSRNSDILTHNDQDICFYLKKPSGNDISDPRRQPSLYVQSTMVDNFYIAVQNAVLGWVYLEKMFISNSRNHSIDISNPYMAQVKECVIENSVKSCVNIRFSKDLSYIGKTERSVLVENTELKKGKGYGISIFGENMVSQHCSIQLINNKISSCYKDGIGIKSLNIGQVAIEKNEMTGNRGNGIILRNVFDTTMFSQVKVSENKVIDSQLYGLAIINTGCYVENNEILQNFKGGVLISSGDNVQDADEADFYRKYPLRNIFNLNIISQNRDSGVVIVGTLKGPTLFNSCKILENTNGLYIKQLKEDNSKKLITHKLYDEVNKDVPGDLVLDKCSLFENLVSGIHVKSIVNKMYLKETSIYGNRSYAVFIQNEEDKAQIVLKGDKSKAKEHIFGYVGGSWGVLYDHRYNACKGNKCNMF